MMNILVENVEVFAKLNYLRDKSLDLVEETWDEVKEEYVDEATHFQDVVLTEEEIDAIIKMIC